VGAKDRPDLDDVAVVYAACEEEVESFSQWEMRFIHDIRMQVQMHVELSLKQIKSLYTIYYQKVDSDEDALEDFLTQYNLHNL
jgi:hypothetical protein